MRRWAAERSCWKRVKADEDGRVATLTRGLQGPDGAAGGGGRAHVGSRR